MIVKYIGKAVAVVVIGIICFACKTNEQKKVLAFYYPWYANPQVSGF